MAPTAPGLLPETRDRFLWLFLLAAAFGVTEAAVVVYLRALIYPEGFGFPMVPPGPPIHAVELAREAATLLVCLGAAGLAGSGWRRFAAFCFVFGVWDLVYYAGLLAFLGWPDSLMDWDLLFLLPGVWTGPVLAPVLIAASLTVVAFLITMRVNSGVVPYAAWWVWGLAAVSLGLLIGSFLANHGPVSRGEAPESFPWALFLPGFLLGWGAYFIAFHLRARHIAGLPPRRRPVDTLF